MKKGKLKWGLNKEDTQIWINDFCDAKGISDDDRKRLHDANEARSDQKWK